MTTETLPRVQTGLINNTLPSVSISSSPDAATRVDSLANSLMYPLVNSSSSAWFCRRYRVPAALWTGRSGCSSPRENIGNAGRNSRSKVRLGVRFQPTSARMSCWSASCEPGGGGQYIRSVECLCSRCLTCPGPPGNDGATPTGRLGTHNLL